MRNYKTYYRRNLPHYQPPGHTFFVTFRLAGSLPKEVIIKLKNEYEENIKRIASIQYIKEKRNEYYTYQSIYFKKFDDYLDKTVYGPKWLKDERIAPLVKEAINKRDKNEYELISYTIMPNHVHMVFTPNLSFFQTFLKDVERSKASLNNNEFITNENKLNEAPASFYEEWLNSYYNLKNMI